MKGHFIGPADLYFQVIKHIAKKFCSHHDRDTVALWHLNSRLLKFTLVNQFFYERIRFPKADDLISKQHAFHFPCTVQMVAVNFLSVDDAEGRNEKEQEAGFHKLFFTDEYRGRSSKGTTRANQRQIF